jgi:hypothetical protein
MHIGWDRTGWKDGYRDAYLPGYLRKADVISARGINGTLDAMFRCSRNMAGWADE